MENNNVKERLENAIKSKDMSAIDEIIAENPDLVSILPEGEYSEDVEMTRFYISIIDEFEAGKKTVAGIPDSLFYYEALAESLKRRVETACSNRLKGYNISPEEKKKIIEDVKEAIDRKVIEVKAQVKYQGSNSLKRGLDLGNLFGNFPERGEE